MVIETITILYYSIATLSISLVLCQKYNKEISIFINKWVYNYDLVSSNDTNDEYDLSLNNSDETYILFNEVNENNEVNEVNEVNENNEVNNTNIKTKKNVIINFE
jgi:hypothetical protein